jgi:hypothetical protein
MIKGLFIWNVALTLVLGVMFYQAVEAEVKQEVSTLDLARLQQELDISNTALADLQQRVYLGRSEVSLLTTQCEITLDLVVNASRYGWWNEKTMVTLFKLSHVRGERNAVQHR